MLLECVLAYSIYKNFFNDYKISNDKIFVDFLIEDKGESFTNLTRRITRKINFIIKNCNHFKIGKTGDPDNRFFSYKDYKSMILLCKSQSYDLIDALEAYYNNYYFNNLKNNNLKRGSASIMTNKENIYYLYIVIN